MPRCTTPPPPPPQVLRNVLSQAKRCRRRQYHHRWCRLFLIPYSFFVQFLSLASRRRLVYKNSWRCVAATSEETESGTECQWSVPSKHAKHLRSKVAYTAPAPRPPLQQATRTRHQHEVCSPKYEHATER